MPTSMTEREIVEMAMAMEEIGRSFYEALAFGSDHREVRDFCLRASQEEAKHFAVLQTLRDTWAGSSTWGSTRLDEDDECVQLAKERILPDSQAVHQVAIGGDKEAALKMAIRMETDAIRFYERMLSSLPAAGNALRAIIAEEENHLGNLEMLRGMARAA